MCKELDQFSTLLNIKQSGVMRFLTLILIDLIFLYFSSKLIIIACIVHNAFMITLPQKEYQTCNTKKVAQYKFYKTECNFRKMIVCFENFTP